MGVDGVAQLQQMAGHGQHMAAVHDLLQAQLAQQQLLLQQQQQALLAQQQFSACPLNSSSSRAVPGHFSGPAAAACAAVPASLRHLLPPPVFFPPPVARSAEPAPEIRALVPEWEPWMLGCSNFSAYSSRSPGLAEVPTFTSGISPFGRAENVQDRMNALWANHCRIWTSVQ